MHLPFDIKSVELSENDYPPMPVADYLATIDSAEIKPTKKSMVSNTNEQMLDLRFKINFGKYKGRVIPSYLNIVHNSSESQRIARETLKKIALIVGVEDILSETKDITCLVGNDLCIHVVQYEFRSNDGSLHVNNKIKKYKNLSEFQEKKQIFTSLIPSAVADELAYKLPANDLMRESHRQFDDEIPF